MSEGERIEANKALPQSWGGGNGLSTISYSPLHSSEGIHLIEIWRPSGEGRIKKVQKCHIKEEKERGSILSSPWMCGLCEIEGGGGRKKFCLSLFLSFSFSLTPQREITFHSGWPILLLFLCVCVVSLACIGKRELEVNFGLGRVAAAADVGVGVVEAVVVAVGLRLKRESSREKGGGGGEQRKRLVMEEDADFGTGGGRRLLQKPCVCGLFYSQECPPLQMSPRLVQI